MVAFLGIGASSLLFLLFFSHLTGFVLVVEFAVALVFGGSLSSLLYLLYKESFRYATYLSLGTGILLILLAVFFPTFPPLRIIDYGAIALGAIFLIISLIVYQYSRSHSTEAPKAH